jgi:2-oxoglutarate dehydrogenase complex dehydrogenase (E1) component-like enzyme
MPPRLEELANGEFQPSSAKSTNSTPRRSSVSSLFRQGLLRPAGRPSREEDHRHRHRSYRAALSLPEGVASQKELAKYPKATEIVWCQEEPRNQGAWYWIASRQHLENEIGLKQKLLLVSRPASSSPAVGYLAKHNEQQKALIESALGKIEY